MWCEKGREFLEGIHSARGHNLCWCPHLLDGKAPYSPTFPWDEFTYSHLSVMLSRNKTLTDGEGMLGFFVHLWFFVFTDWVALKWSINPGTCWYNMKNAITEILPVNWYTDFFLLTQGYFRKNETVMVV